MNSIATDLQIENVINQLFDDAKYDRFKMMKVVPKFIFKPMEPLDFKEVYLSISKEQGEDLKQLIIANGIQNIVEFGTSFGISTLFLAQGALETDGKIITTELVESKALKAIENFKNAGVNEIIDVRIGDALDTLKNHTETIDLLILDGWKDLYLPLFQLLESNFHKNTIIYVDNADMKDTQAFLNVISQNDKYQLESKYEGKVVLITSIH